ncbi:MAG: hypothetical protein FJX61_11160 [Alphaproteobacteria bacterium]|nr:hypothetical protein [Alphaproteobacteria bacterium]
MPMVETSSASLKARMAAGETVFGTFVFLPDPGVVEILGLAGMDYVIIDLEHSPKNWETVANMVRAALLYGIAPLVRVSANNEKEILQALELGAEGVVVPFVQTGEDARRAARAIKYAPAGNRGTCTLTRVAHYGGLRSGYLDHTQRENERVLLVAQVEDTTAADNIVDIVGVDPGPDVILIGRSDLASSMGRPGQVNDRAVVAATERILDAIQRAPGGFRTAAIGAYAPSDVGEWLAKGCRFFFYAADGLILLNAAKEAVGAFRHAVKAVPAGRKVAAG